MKIILVYPSRAPVIDGLTTRHELIDSQNATEPEADDCSNGSPLRSSLRIVMLLVEAREVLGSQILASDEEIIELLRQLHELANLAFESVMVSSGINESCRN